MLNGAIAALGVAVVDFALAAIIFLAVYLACRLSFAFALLLGLEDSWPL
jgi:hypothetical protein